MSYKEQCKAEGAILARVKVIRTVLSGTSQKDTARLFQCSKNTVGAVMKQYGALSKEERELIHKSNSLRHEDIEQCVSLSPHSRAPQSNCRSLSEEEAQKILSVHKKITIGPRRMYTHLLRQGADMSIFTLAKIKGCYKRHGLLAKKVRTANRERRPLYDYTKIAAFERLHMDTKHILDKHALPEEIYNRFKNTEDLPFYQWTIQDAKTRMRFLAYSHELSSFYGQRFLLLTVLWLRAHGIHTHLTTLFDGGAEFCSARTKKLEGWNTFFAPYGVTVEQTGGDKVRQNIIERSHRSDDEEFYVPRGVSIHTKEDFLLEAERWNIYFNIDRAHGGIEGMTPAEKLAECGYTNAEAIGRFPTFILEDVHRELAELPTFMAQQPMRKVLHYPQIASQNVLTYYLQVCFALYTYWETRSIF